MILQELINLYDRLDSNESTEIWELGFSPESIHYAIHIDVEGKYKAFEDLRTLGDDGKLHAPIFVAPKREGKRAGKANKDSPYFLWDNSQFVLGVEVKNKKTKPKPANLHFFINKQKELMQKTKASSNAVDAIIKFLESDNERETLLNSSEWSIAVEENLTGFNLSFIVEGDGKGLIFEQDSIKQVWRDYYFIMDEESPQKVCLVTGNKAPIYRLQPTIKKGVGSGGKNDIPLISFNENVFESYNLSGNTNAQINRFSAGKFTHALNYLTMQRNHNLRMADTLTLFWAEKNRVAEDFFGGLFDNQLIEEDGHNKNLEVFLKRIRDGKIPDELDDDSRFFVLGLAPNSARISVRYWHTDSVRDMGKKVIKHFADLSIVPQKKEQETSTISMWFLLREMASMHKMDNVPSNIAGPLMRSILSGTKYPMNTLSILVSRMRTDQGYDRLNFYRASFTKAILNRNYNKELTVALDYERKTVPYCLGRLFAVLEVAQKEASGGKLNSTIKDRYFSSASATPKLVFPRLLNLAQNHLKKVKGLKPGWAYTLDKYIAKIVNDLSEFPSTLKLDEQGEFAIGYYHQSLVRITLDENNSEEGEE